MKGPKPFVICIFLGEGMIKINLLYISNFWLPLDYRDTYTHTYIHCTYIYMHIYSEMYVFVNF